MLYILRLKSEHICS